MKTLIHIIPTLGSGGAENVLTRLVELKKQKNLKQYILTTQGTPNDFNHEKVNKFCTVLHWVDNKSRVKEIFKENPNTKIIGWMYKGILWAHGLSFVYGYRSQKIVWNIRHSDFGPKEYYQKILLYVFGLGTRLLNPKIIYCSHRSKEVHEKAFFSSANQSVIVNRLAKVPDLNFDDHLPNNKPYILFVGRFNPQKGPERLRMISEKILNQYKDHELLIAGVGWSLDYFPSSISSRVKLLGPQKEIFPLYNRAKALLFTSTYGEGYPNVLVEAMAVGTPIVALDAGDAKRILAEYPFGEVFYSLDLFMEKLKTYIKVPVAYDERHSEGRKQQKKLDFSLTVKEYEEFIWND